MAQSRRERELRVTSVVRFAVRYGLTVACLLALGCSDELKPATYVEPVFGEPCALERCSSAGECIPQNGAPLCLCWVGYQGPSCERCEAGFHRDAHDRCVPDKRCVEQAQDPCAPYGQCTDENNVIECACKPGYAGPRCNVCADRHGRDPWGACLPLVLGDGSPTLEPMTCEPGYTGPRCTECARGHHRFGGGCVPDKTCEPSTCPEHGECNVVRGEVVCSCLPEYAGVECDACASGHHREQGSCVPDEVCKADSCSEHAQCSLHAGKVVCECVAGYRGEGCSDCAPGYHASQDACVPDETCSSNTCTGRASCVVVGGETECHCEAGWGGAECTQCINLATEATAFEFVSGWPTDKNICTTRVELSVSRMTLRSREGDAPVYLCAGSSFNGLVNQHVQIEAGPTKVAQLAFWQPVVMMSLDFGATLQPLSLDLLADGVLHETISLPAKAKGALTLRLDPPATVVSFRSRTEYVQTFGIDNVVYHYEQCR